MRTWSVERPVGERESETDVFIGFRNEGETAFYRVAIVSPFYPMDSWARWIADACNEKEQMDAHKQAELSDEWGVRR